MSTKYNAFISYKHAPEDNKVAEAVHKGLERFHIPHKIRKKTGVKRIDRIFRDKDELPITSDLSDSIADALEGSDYLIVICSTNTKESAWVPREIEYFLKNHSKRQVFTVLVNGEPRDVIPEILTYEETKVTDEDGVERTVRIPVEPLSCDFRMPLGKAKRTELPRLACGIIGCAYDELMNRRRAYRMKQLFAGVSVALALMAAFSAYMYYSRDKIRKNYLESLRNQSKYLANESTRLLEKEQRITAMQLALEALPSGENDDRPVTAEAVRALTAASLAYESKNGNNIHAAWNYRMPGVVSYFKLNSEGKKLAVVDAGDVLALWDTEDHEKILYLDDIDNGIKGTAFLDDNTFAYWDSHTIKCYDADKGEELWTYTLDEDYFMSEEAVTAKDSFYLTTYDLRFLKFDTRSGELQGEILFKERISEEDVSISEAVLSPDGKKIAFRGGRGMDSYIYGVIELNDQGLDSGKPISWNPQSDWVKNIAWVDDDSLMIASTKADATSSVGYGDMEIISTDHTDIKCMNATGLREEWKADFVCNGIMLESGFVTLGNGDVAYFSGNVNTVYDAATGQEKYYSNVNSSVLSVSDRDGDGTPVYITENGGYAVPATGVDTDAVYYRKYFTDEMRQAVVCKGVYARQRYSHEIIYYGVDVYDEEWKPLSTDAALKGTVKDFRMDDRYLAVLSSEDGAGPEVQIYSLDEKGEHFRIPLEDEKVYGYNLLGIRGDSVYLGYSDTDKFDLVTVDIKSQKTSKIQLFRMVTTFDDAAVMKDDKIVFVYYTEDYKTGLGIYELESGNRKEIILPEEAGYISNPPVYYEKDGMVCLRCGDEEYVIDAESGKAEKIGITENWAGAVCYSDNSYKGRYAISDGKNILLAGKDGKVSTTIKCPGISPLGITFLKDALYVLYNDGGLYKYSPDSGELTEKGDASVYNYYTGSTEFDYDEENDILYIKMEKLVDAVDMQNGIETARILDCFGYHKGRDIFITSGKGEDGDLQVGYFRRYTVQELIDKAHAILKDEELPEDMKSFYGVWER